MNGHRGVAVLVIASIAALGTREARLAAGPQPPARIHLAHGTELVKLLRGAMGAYLDRRIEPGRVPIPPKLKAVAELPLAVAVTLRAGDAPPARVVETGLKLGANAAAAVLKAMRSPHLPDRVTHKVLDSLRVEVEVLGSPQPVTEQAIAETVVPGLVGLSLSRGPRRSYVLPSEAFRRGWDAEQMRRQALMRLPPAPGDAETAPQWSAYGTKHFVGFPDGKVVWLYRGKILVPPDSIDEGTLAAAAESVGTFLAAHQDRSGRYGTPSAPASRRGLRDHLRATYAMARLAKVTKHKEFALSVNAALGFAARSVVQTEQGAYVATADGDDQLAATAWMLLAAMQASPSDQSRPLLGKFTASLMSAWTEKGFSTRLDGREWGRARPADVYLCDMALVRASASLAQPAAVWKRLERLRHAAAGVRPDDGDALLWKLRAGLPLTVPMRQAPPAWLGGLRLKRVSGPARDASGALAPASTAATTAGTALAATCLAEALAGPKPFPDLPRDYKPAQLLLRDAAPADVLAARRFCYQMMVKPREAWFAPDHADWTGGVRQSPRSATVTLPACAAAIEAFLAR